MTNQEYAKLVAQKSPPSPWGMNVLKAYGVGGLFCVLGQALVSLYKAAGLSAGAAGGACSVTLIFLGALLTTLHVYDNIAKHAGAGTLVPITGFANAMVATAIEFKSEGLVAGMSANMFKIAGPVLVYGVIASVVYGLFLVLFKASPW